MNSIKVIVIDATNREIREQFITSPKEMQLLVGGTLERAATLTNHDDVFVDEDGMAKNYEHAFAIYGAQLFVGSGFVIGEADEEGHRTDAKTTVEQLKMAVSFTSVHDTI